MSEILSNVVREADDRDRRTNLPISTGLVIERRGWYLRKMAQLISPRPHGALACIRRAS